MSKEDTLPPTINLIPEVTIYHQALPPSPMPAATENMDLLIERAPTRIHRIPAPQVSQPSRGVWDSQETVEQKHHGSFSERVAPSWPDFTHSDEYTDSCFGSLGPTISGAGSAQDTLAGGYDWPSIFDYPLQYGTVGSYGSSDTGYSLPSNMGSSNIDPELIQHDSPSTSQYPTYLTDKPLVASPDQLSTAAPSPAPFLYQSDSPTHAAGYVVNQCNDYFDFYPTYPIRQEQQPASGPQGQESYPNPNMGDIALSQPYHPTHNDVGEGTIANHTSPEHYGCPCGAGFGRQTDLERHQRTARKHCDPGRLVCLERGCTYLGGFTRSDNFKVHYMRHGKSDKEADEFIKEWRALVNSSC